MPKLLLILAPLIIGLCCCGGGGGGSGEEDTASSIPANVFISLNPQFLDSGDRTKVEVEVSELNSLGAAIKVRFPAGLKYIIDSGQLTVDGVRRSFDSTTSATSGDKRYLIFYLKPSDLGEERQGRLSFWLTGVSPVDDGDIEVDADIDDPAVRNTVEFTVSDPKFEPQGAASVEVRGEPISTPTPTPTPTPTK